MEKTIKILLIIGILIITIGSTQVSAKEFTSKRITHYGYNCRGCSGITASGWNIRRKGIFYKDREYGRVFICATSKKIKMYSILQFKHKRYGVIKCIVLDRGVGGYNIDLLTKSERHASKLGVQRNTKVTLLRSGK